MTNPDIIGYEYVRVYRDVVPSESLTDLVKKAAELVDDDSQFEFKHEVEPVVFAASSLRVTLFERRAQAGTKAAGLLVNIDKRLRSPTRSVQKQRRVPPKMEIKKYQETVANPLPGQLQMAQAEYIGKDQPLIFRSTTLTDCTKNDYRHLGTEIGLVIEEGDVSKMLVAQTGIINDDIATTHAGRRLAGSAEPDQPLVIPILRAPFLTETDRDLFIERLQPKLPVYGAKLGPISIIPKSITI